MAVEIEKDEIERLVPSIQQYFREELDQEICEMRAGLLLDFLLKEAGPFAYNRGVRDAERYFREKLEDLSGSCYEHGLTYWTEKKR